MRSHPSTTSACRATGTFWLWCPMPDRVDPREPKRIQRRRTKGWRTPEGAVYVGRPSKWGNPHRLGDYDADHRDEAAEPVVERFRHDLIVGTLGVTLWDVRQELAGKDLICWCPPDQACHADVLLELANA